MNNVDLLRRSEALAKITRNKIMKQNNERELEPVNRAYRSGGGGGGGGGNIAALLINTEASFTRVAACA